MPRKASPLPEIDTPFGYTFDHSEPSDPSYPPPGPPLLDNNESNLLESFFNDPNNIDPTILSLPTDFQTDPGNIFGTNSLDWASQSMAPMPGTSSSVQTQRAAPTRQMQPSADVYQAAGILHNNNNNSSSGRTDSTGAFDSYSYALASAGTDSSQLNGFGVPLNNAQNAEYDLGEGGNNGFYNGYETREAPNPYAAGLHNRLREPARPRLEMQLNFGSDDNFRESAYIPPEADMPDKQLIEAVDHNFSQVPDLAKTGDHRGSQGRSATRKRGRPPSPRSREKGSEEDGRSSQGPTSGAGAKEDNSDMEHGQSHGSNKRSKKRLDLTSSAANQSGSASNTTQSEPLASPGSKKQKLSSNSMSKERRDNLTEEQKRNNHILSEQKRRNLIKQGFEDLNRMVPELRASGLSKSNMLVEAARFMRRLREDNEELRLEVESLDHG